MTSFPRHRQAVPRRVQRYFVDDDLYLMPGPDRRTVWPHVLFVWLFLALVVTAIYLLGGYVDFGQ